MKGVRVLELESSPEHALQTAWHSLDRRFYTKRKPGHYLLQSLLQGSTITPNDPDTLFAFACSCQAATDLHQNNQGLLVSLEEETTQGTIFNRLERDLYVKWQTYRKEHFGRDRTVPFEYFSSWINIQAEIYLDCQTTSQDTLFVNRTIPTPKQPPKHQNILFFMWPTC